MELSKALHIAEHVKNLLAPHCLRIEIAGSIRRKKDQVKDIELVAIPKPWATGLFLDGIAVPLSNWQKIKGDVENSTDVKYTQRILPNGAVLDLFFAEPGNFGWILALRTGSKDFNQHVMLPALKRNGYTSNGGWLYWHNKREPTREENRVFQLAGMPHLAAWERNYTIKSKNLHA